MGSLQLAANYIELTGWWADHTPFDTYYGHLQIVNDGFEIEVQAPFSWDTADEVGYFAYPSVRTHLDPDHTTGTNDPDKYEIVNLDTGSRDPDKMWDLLVNIHDQFVLDSPNFEYVLSQNSNSYVTTLLWMVGIDVHDYLAQVTPSLVADGFPGANRNLLTDGIFEVGIPIAFSLDIQATTDDDFLRTGDGEDTLSGMAGHDELMGGEAADTLVGGTGNDTLNGQEGSDLIDYSGAEGFVNAAIETGIVVTLTETVNAETGENTFSAQVTDSWGGTDTLLNVERITGTTYASWS